VKQNGNKNCGRKRSGKDGQAEFSLKFWFTNVHEQDNRVDGQLMRQKAELSKEMGKDDLLQQRDDWKKRKKTLFTNGLMARKKMPICWQQNVRLEWNGLKLFTNSRRGICPMQAKPELSVMPEYTCVLKK
jgi:hypothetical protein